MSFLCGYRELPWIYPPIMDQISVSRLLFAISLLHYIRCENSKKGKKYESKIFHCGKKNFALEQAPSLIRLLYALLSFMCLFVYLGDMYKQIRLHRPFLTEIGDILCFRIFLPHFFPYQRNNAQRILRGILSPELQ